MITNDRQYKIANTQVENFQHSLEMLAIEQASAKNIHPKLLQIQRNAIESQLNDLLAEVREYEDLKEGKIAITEVNNLRDLPIALIKARIANGLTQAELAEQIGVKMQQIQRYEAERYDTASIKTLIRIAEQLNISINADVQIRTVEAPDFLDVKNYPFKQMFQRKWFGNFSGTYNEAVIDSKNLIEKFFDMAGVSNLQYSLTKKSIRTGSTLNEFALNAWYTQVLVKAKDQKVSGRFDKS
ncbi:MAG: helix-turn-helix transcriptional regulator [Chitinophagaceae bacterium]|nr:helix-turn-helix transcriptional regulator [Chitinophagaceae bacterium]